MCFNRKSKIQNLKWMWLCVMLFASGNVMAAEFHHPVRIGALTDGWGATWEAVGLRDGLKELGYRENHDFVIGIRFTQGDPEALPRAAKEFIEQGVDILFTGGRNTAKAAQLVTKTIPIVFAGGGDPVGLGLIKSFSRPGGNITGITEMDLELGPKRLEVFKVMIPGLKRVLFPYSAIDPYSISEAKMHRQAARDLDIQLVEKPVRTEKEGKIVIKQARKHNVQGILSPRPVSLNIPGCIMEVSAKLAIPTMFASTFFVENGGLASYSPHTYESGRMAARIVDKILKGQKPGDIPVEVNPKIEFLINLKAGKKLGIDIAPEALFRANRVIR